MNNTRNQKITNAGSGQTRLVGDDLGLLVVAKAPTSFLGEGMHPVSGFQATDDLW